MDKKSFLFYMNWEVQIDLLTDEEVRRFNKNLFRYHRGEEVELVTISDKITWAGILPALEINKEKYEKKCLANQENGQLGGAPKGNQNASKTKTTQNNPDNPIKENSKKKNDKSKKEIDNRKNTNDNWELGTGKSQLEKENSQDTSNPLFKDTSTGNTGLYTGTYTGTSLLGSEIDELNYIMNTEKASADPDVKDYLFKMLIQSKLQEKILASGCFKQEIFDHLKEDNLNYFQRKIGKEKYDKLEPLFLEYIKLFRPK